MALWIEHQSESWEIAKLRAERDTLDSIRNDILHLISKYGADTQGCDALAAAGDYTLRRSMEITQELDA